VPPNSIAIGDPVRIYGADDVELSAAIKSIGFASVAFGVNQEWEDRIRRYEASTEVRSQEFASHFQDEIIEEQ
jgi:HKD family nuclease